MNAPGTLSEALQRAARSRCGLQTVEHDGRSADLPYEVLLQRALTGAGALSSAGLTAGDRVALLIPETAQFIEAFFAIQAAGLVPVPLVPPAQAGDVVTFERQTRRLLQASRSAAVVTTPDVAPLLKISDLDSLQRVMTTDALAIAAPLPAPVSLSPDAPALLQFTSGSTAAPKGVVLSHRNLLTNVAAIAGPHGLGVTAEDVGVSWLPLYHDMGLIGMLLTAVWAANPAVLLSPVLFLKRPTVWLEAMSRHRATVSFAPNFAYELCLRRVKSSQIAALDLSNWRVAGCGAEPIRPDTLEAFAERFAPAGFRASAFVPSYGLAEHSLAVTMSRQGFRLDHVDANRLGRDSIATAPQNGSPAVRLVGCGRPFPGHDVRIVSEDGHPLPERHVGRILARGPSVMGGYFDDPAATAEALRDGWLETGDLGYIADGSLFVCGRIKDLIIRQGRKYHPPDIESAIADLDGLRSFGVVVFAVTRANEPDEVVAVLEARASAVSDAVVDQVRRRVRETAGLELDRVVVAPPGSIPRTTSGKIRRAETRARLESGTLAGGREDRAQ
ncbi:MAG: AMP-binding protein [Vicinamibacterales bacterium]